ncbi:protein kinase domain-containing protein [Haliangium sp.]|uniref:protein kinase domain-containing protein n=2 Tax=Haliangium sp. TaxID=2663208 RepID=UPI003D0C78FD
MRQPVPFGKYLLLDRVSVGGMAEIFKAKSYGVEGFEKIIAIKRILPSMGEDRDFIKMFIDEAKIVGQLAHANICQIFELGRTEGIHFIAMEYIWGKDGLQIQNRLKKAGEVMSVPMACHIAAKVCEGLDYAHRKRDPMGTPMQIVHRDCSPQNILVSYEGEVKIIDFGIAKASMRSSRTMAGVLKGKFGYMSPEQVRGLPLDRRSDIFALGTVLYEMLTRERLFQSESDFSTLEKVRNVAIDPPRMINPDIPEEVEAIVMKALAPDPDIRYQWCSDMLGDLQRYLMSQPAVFSSKSLAEWMKQHFKPELERERKLMEEYKKLGRDGLIAGVPQAKAEVDVEQEMGEAGEPDDPTMLGGPNFEDILGTPGNDTQEDEGDDFEEEAPTEIFGEVETNDESKEDMARAAELAQSAPKISVEGPTMNDSGSAHVRTLLEPSGSAAVRAAVAAAAPPRQSPSRPLPLAAPAETALDMQAPEYARQSAPPPPPPAPGHGYMFDESAFGSTASVARIPPAPTARRRPSLFKDVGIGVGIALMVLGVFVAIKFLWMDRAGSGTPAQLLGSVSVTVPKGKRATVNVDGREVGQVDDTAPLVVGELPLGSHTVKVVQEGAEPCEQAVVLDDNNVAAAVECALTPLVTQLVIEGITIDHDIKVSGVSVAKEQRIEPIELEPGTLYDITISLGTREVDRFSVKLAPGETVRRRLPVGTVAIRNDDEVEGDDDEDDDRRRASHERDDDDDDRERRRSRRDRDDDGERSSGRDERDRDDGKQVGYLIANSTPWAKVIIDGKPTGLTTPIPASKKVKLSPGKHRVVFEYQGQRFPYPIEIKPGETFKLIKKLPVAN